MAPRLSETTVAAPRTSFLRASVNAVRGRSFGRFGPAKIGNATHKRVEEVIVGDVPLVPMELRLPGKKAGGAAEQGRGAGTIDVRTHRDAGVTR